MNRPANRTDPIPTTSTRSTGDVEIRIHHFGSEGRRVLAAHATGFNALVWTPLVDALTHCAVFAPDFRAHGASTTQPDADLSWPLFGDDVLATIASAGWTNPTAGNARPVGIGHSMGGAALLLAEQKQPGTFAGLWLYEPIIFPPEVRATFGTQENPLAAGALRRRPTFSSRFEAEANYASKPPMNAFTPQALAGYVTGGFIDEADGSVRLACRPEDESRTFTSARTCHAFEHLEAVTCPVVVVRGALTEMSPAAIAEPAVKALPSGTLSVHDELSHFGPMEDPTGLAREIDAFIASLTS